MRHKTLSSTIDGREILFFVEPGAEVLLVQPVDSHDLEEMPSEVEYIEANATKPFVLVAVKIKRWNDELTPWPAPPVFGKIPFGTGAETTLRLIEKIVDGIRNGSCGLPMTDLHPASVFLGGYSLAGLFSLWAAYNTAVLDGVVAASPSVWYKDWLDYSRSHSCPTRKVYLSLGDKESHSKNKLMATVADAIAEQKTIFDDQGVVSTMVWNPGNHFTDNGVRTAKGFVWLME